MKTSTPRSWTLALAILLASWASAWLLCATRPPAVEAPHTPSPRRVEVLAVQSTQRALTVVTQGTLRAHTEVELSAQVRGVLVEVADSFVEGGRFRRGDLLVQIDPRDYRLAVATAEARVAEEKQALLREREEATLAREDWEIYGEGAPSPLALREPQLAKATARLKSARAELARVRLDLERTAIRAPFDGFVRARRADLGQFVTAGTAVAAIFRSDVAEIRLPVTSRDLGLLVGDGETPSDAVRGLAVDLFEPGGAAAAEPWRAVTDRLERVVDARSRNHFLVARIERPFDTEPSGLALGVFLRAEIRGRERRGLIALPTAALDERGRVAVVDGEDRVWSRRVEVLQQTEGEVLTAGGLRPGELVCAALPRPLVDGMRVQPVRVAAPAAPPHGIEPPLPRPAP